MNGLRARLGTATTAARLRLELRRRSAYDRLDPDQQAAWRADRLAALRRHATEHAPGYRELHRGLEDAPLDELPIVTKDDVVDRFDELVTDRRLTAAALRRRVDHDDERAARGYRVVSSSGSSGRPGLFAFSPGEWVHLLAAAARARAVSRTQARSDAGPVREARIGSPSPWHLSTQLPTTLPDPRRPLRTFSAASDVAELRAGLEAWQPHVLSAYPSVLGALAHEQLAGRLAIHPVRVFSGGERLLPATADAVEQAWGARPYDQYLTAEAGFLAVECPHHTGMHVLDDHAVLEVVDAAGRPVPPGEEGARVLVTVLTSRTLPLIRYELGDAATLVDARCPCGRPSPRITSVASAGRDLLRLAAPDGGTVTVHPVLFTSVLDHAAVRSWQVVREDDRLAVLVVDPSPGLDLARLAVEVGDALEAAGAARVPVEVAVVDELCRAASGKAGLVISVD